MSKVATRWQVMKVATGELGYVERGGRDGRSGNITKYWKAHYPQWQGQPWCGAFIYWVLRKVGVVDKPLGKTGIFYTPAIVAAAKRQGIWRSDSVASLNKIKPGDLVLFNFGSGGAKHVEFAEKALGNGRVQCIGGNTSGTNRGSQNDGGGVYRRTRDRGSIMGYVDMSRWLADNASGLSKSAKAKQPAETTSSNWSKKAIAEHGVLSTATIKRWQAEVGVKSDGIVGPATRKAVQRWLKVSADGIWGRQTYRALQKKVGSKADGLIGPNTIKALQRYLNRTRKK